MLQNWKKAEVQSLILFADTKNVPLEKLWLLDVLLCLFVTLSLLLNAGFTIRKWRKNWYLWHGLFATVAVLIQGVVLSPIGWSHSNIIVTKNYPKYAKIHTSDIKERGSRFSIAYQGSNRSKECVNSGISASYVLKLTKLKDITTFCGHRNL